jgi:multiple sugar transport system substrate-binding protein
VRKTHLITAVAIGATAILALSSCSNNDSGSSSSGATTITVAHGFTDYEAKALNSAVSDWNTQNPDMKVNLVFNGGNDSALKKTIAGFTAGNYPDAAYEYGSSAATLARQPKLVDLTDTVNSSDFNWNDFFPSEQQAATVDGKVVGIPALVDNLALVYNKKMFADAGIAPPNANWTWDDFRNAAKALTDPANHTFGWAYVNDGSEDTVWRWEAMLWQAGGELLNSDNTKPAFDSSAGLASLQQLQDMAVTDKSVYLDTGNQAYMDLFNSNKVGMLWTGPWDLSSINSDVNYGVTILPGYNGDHESIAGPDLWMLFDHSSAQAAAATKFITWLTSPEEHIKFAIATGDLPLTVSETKLPQYQDFLKKYPAEKVFVANLGNVKHVRPNLASYP